MKIGVLSDAHGNPDGVRACLDVLACQGTEQLIFLGDVVGYLPDAREAIDLLRDAGAHFLMGNHEAMLLGRLRLNEKRDQVYRLRTTWATLGLGDLRFLDSLTPFYDTIIDNRKLLFVHGSPSNPLCGYIYPDTPIDAFACLGVHTVFMGHTHRPFIRTSGDVQVVNVGSCGLPRDHGNLASCAIFDTTSGHCDILRVPFPARRIILRHGANMHPDVIACLQRQGPVQLPPRSK